MYTGCFTVDAVLDYAWSVTFLYFERGPLKQIPRRTLNDNDEYNIYFWESCIHSQILISSNLFISKWSLLWNAQINKKSKYLRNVTSSHTSRLIVILRKNRGGSMKKILCLMSTTLQTILKIKTYNSHPSILWNFTTHACKNDSNSISLLFLKYPHRDFLRYNTSLLVINFYWKFLTETAHQI